MRSALLTLIFSALSLTAQAQTCAKPGPVSPLGEKLARIALDEYRRFNGHRIDAQGRLWKFGNVETETEPVEGDRYAWRRVWRYWQALDVHRPSSLMMRRATWLPELLDNPASAPARARMTTMKEALAAVPEGELAELQREALVRAAIADTPWSAAFISFLMHEAGVADEAFSYSSAHATYIRPALEDAPGYAYRACDPRKTRPRVGDLICYSRGGKPPLRNLADWREHAGELDGRIKSHCDLVVSTDAAAAKMESIGGNVLQSVTRRKLMLKGDGSLSDRHQLDQHKPRPGSECARDETCHKGDLNLQQWGVLLQLR